MENNNQSQKSTPFLKKICNLQLEVCKLKAEVEEMKKELKVIKKSLKNRG